MPDKKIKNMVRKRKGQALVEFFIILTVIPIFVMGTVTIARIFIINQRIHQAARHGAFLMATERVKWNTAKSEVFKYFENGYPKFDIANISVKHDTVRVGFVSGDKVTVSYKTKIYDFSKSPVFGKLPKIEKTYEASVVCGRASIL